MQKIKNRGTKKLAKFPPDLAVRLPAGFAARRRFGAGAAGLLFKVVLRVRVAIFLIVGSSGWIGFLLPTANCRLPTVSISPKFHRKAA